MSAEDALHWATAALALAGRELPPSQHHRTVATVLFSESPFQIHLISPNHKS